MKGRNSPYHAYMMPPISISSKLLTLILAILLILSRDYVALVIGNFGFVLANRALVGRRESFSLLGISESFLSRAAQRAANDQSFHYGLGLVHHGQGASEEAVEAWRAARIDTDLFITWATKSWRNEQYQDALTWLSYAVILAPTSADAYYWTGRVFNEVGQSDKALTALKTATSLSPDTLDIWYELGQTYQAMERWTRAIEALDSAAHAPAGYGHVGKSNALFELAFIKQYEMVPPRLDSAFVTYAAAIQDGSFLTKPWQEANASYQRGLILSKNQEWEAARTEYEEAISLSPNSYSFRLSYARALLALGRPESAIDTLKHASRLRPSRVEALVLLGDIYRDMQKLDVASSYYSRAATLEPDSEMVYERLLSLDKAPGTEADQ